MLLTKKHFQKQAQDKVILTFVLMAISPPSVQSLCLVVPDKDILLEK